MAAVGEGAVVPQLPTTDALATRPPRWWDSPYGMSRDSPASGRASRRIEFYDMVRLSYDAAPRPELTGSSPSTRLSRAS